MTKIYLTVLVTLGALSNTTYIEGKNIAWVTQLGYRKIMGVKNGYYQYGPPNSRGSYYSTNSKAPLSSRIYAMVAYHAKALGIPMPTVFLTDDWTENASAIDRIIFLNIGLLTSRSEVDISGVIAHECGHIKCKHNPKKAAARKKHFRIAAGSTCGMLLLCGGLIISIKKENTEVLDLAFIGIFSYLLPKIIRSRLYLKYSRKCEYEADKAGCHNIKTTQDYIALLTKRAKRNQTTSEQTNLQSTHPSNHDRIKALKEHLNALLAQQNPALAGA